MLGEKIKEIREKEGLTQEEFAKEVFVSRSTVTKWETGKSLPSIDTLRLISEKYNVSIDELLHNEAESGFYKDTGKGRDIELTKKQKIIAFVAFFLVAAVIFVTLSLSKIGSSSQIDQYETENFRESMKLVPAILDEWTKEKGYCYEQISSGLGVASSMSRACFEIYRNEADREKGKELYSLDFTLKDSTFDIEARAGGKEYMPLIEDALKELEEASDLIKRISGSSPDYDKVQEMTYKIIDGGSPDGIAEVEDYLESQAYFGTNNSMIGMDITDLEKMYENDKDVYDDLDIPDEPYEVKLSIFLDYHFDSMN